MTQAFNKVNNKCSSLFMLILINSEIEKFSQIFPKFHLPNNIQK